MIYDRVRVVVVGRFHMGDFIGPGTWVGSTEDPKVCFNLLIDMFHFAVGFGVICSREGEVIV